MYKSKVETNLVTFHFHTKLLYNAHDIQHETIRSNFSIVTLVDNMIIHTSYTCNSMSPLSHFFSSEGSFSTVESVDTFFSSPYPSPTSLSICLLSLFLLCRNAMHNLLHFCITWNSSFSTILLKGTRKAKIIDLRKSV